MKDLSAWWYRICETLGFLRKVYGILTAQLFITVLIGAVCLTVPQVRATVQARYVQKALIVVDITHLHINTKSILVISCTHTHTHAVPCWVLGWSLVRWLFLCCFSSRKIRLQWTTSYSWHLWVSSAPHTLYVIYCIVILFSDYSWGSVSGYCCHLLWCGSCSEGFCHHHCCLHWPHRLHHAEQIWLQHMGSEVGNMHATFSECLTNLREKGKNYM